MLMTTLATRVKARMAALKLTQDELAAISGLSQTAIQKIVSGATRETRKLPQLAKALKCTIEYLGTGAENEPVPPGDDLESVKVGNIKLSAGISGYYIDYHDYDDLPPIYFRKDWLDRKGFKADKLIATRVSGRSMEPKLHDGDTVVINTDQTRPIDGNVFAVNLEGEPVIKRMIRERGEWWLQSDNADRNKYPNKICIGDACIIIGEVVHFMSDHL